MFVPNFSGSGSSAPLCLAAPRPKHVWAQASPSLPLPTIQLSSPFLFFPGKPRFCLGEGSYSSSLGVPSTTLTVTGLLFHWPPGHQTSCLSQCPDLALPVPPRLWARPHSSRLPLLLTALCDVCLGRLSSRFVCRGKSWAREEGDRVAVRVQRGRGSGEVGSRG